jgi:hypothetical protein
VPDIIAIKNGRAFGLELKSVGGRMSDSQRTTHSALESRAKIRVPVSKWRQSSVSMMHFAS